jgi:gluconate kinase
MLIPDDDLFYGVCVCGEVTITTLLAVSCHISFDGGYDYHCNTV